MFCRTSYQTVFPLQSAAHFILVMILMEIFLEARITHRHGRARTNQEEGIENLKTNQQNLTRTFSDRSSRCLCKLSQLEKLSCPNHEHHHRLWASVCHSDVTASLESLLISLVGCMAAWQWHQRKQLQNSHETSQLRRDELSERQGCFPSC